MRTRRRGKATGRSRAGEIIAATGPLSDTAPTAFVGFDHAGGHRGTAKAVRGAKKFVRSRLRFHENAATRALACTAGHDAADGAASDSEAPDGRAQDGPDGG